jgi:ubiquitin-activating enzyme E1
MQSVEYEGMKWTLWDRWVLEGDLTVQQVLDWFVVSLKAMGTCKL